MSSFIHGYSFIKNVKKHQLVVNTPAIKTARIKTHTQLKAMHCCTDVRYLGDGNKLPWLELPHANIIVHTPTY